ncbi:uncharacterized protein LOC133549016 [Nerophis ophidion]|uniref:uncharacterized protein LOC133549016 n=1 Tax=Nerophis ophidion TaxID=159077 RepID=UPI002ADFB992|nr:uncharacterized protein LOC133549016 [Nerophis ophidion]
MAGVKKAVPTFSVEKTTERMARDPSFGAIETKDGRKASMPEVGQPDYYVPDAWKSEPDKEMTLKVKASCGEWAHFLMAPSYDSLMADKTLTSNFRASFLADTYDFMFRRFKKAAYKAAKELEAKGQELSVSEEEEEVDPPQVTKPPPQTRPALVRSTSLPDALVGYYELKKVKSVVPARANDQDVQEYLKSSWALVKCVTCNDEARRLWLICTTGQELGAEATAEEHYRRMVIEGPDDEESKLDLARKHLKKGQPLKQVWYILKKSVPVAQSVKTLRRLTKGMRDEMDFVTMDPSTTTCEQMDEVVRVWDIKRHYQKKKRAERRKRGHKRQKSNTSDIESFHALQDWSGSKLRSAEGAFCPRSPRVCSRFDADDKGEPLV